MIVYHGSNVIVSNPDIEHSFRSLDFGKGFYVTTVKEQAERWAKRKAGIWDKERALKEIKMYPNYDQIAFISQRAINQLLCYESFYEVRYE